jgi:hypothetical protein
MPVRQRLPRDASELRSRDNQEEPDNMQTITLKPERLAELEDYAKVSPTNDRRCVG